MQYHSGRHGNQCWCGALWLDAGERALYLDWAEARAQGVNAHLRKQEFGEVSLTAEATESFIGCSLHELRSAPTSDEEDVFKLAVFG